jgi:hypothetical protein
MFLIPYLKKINPKSFENLCAQLSTLRLNMSITRKVFRFGGHIPSILKITKRFKDH